MRPVIGIAAFLLASCHRLQPDTNDMDPGQILSRSTHLFIGVIEKHEFPSPWVFRVDGKNPAEWRVVDIRVRVENVLRGSETRPVIDIYEAFPTGGLSGDWNATQVAHRYLFPVRLEDGRYHLTRDLWRSVYPVYSGRHTILPLEDSAPFWERFALLEWWVGPDRSPGFGQTMHTDPGVALGRWRMAKILRGLLRHPEKDVRLAACADLLLLAAAQDECWNDLAPSDRESLHRFWNAVPLEYEWNLNRNFERHVRDDWQSIMDRHSWLSFEQDALRLCTTINNPALRREFCTQYRGHFPQDTDNGCPADRVPPATIVTQNGDVPLIGAWPRN